MDATERLCAKLDDGMRELDVLFKDIHTNLDEIRRINTSTILWMILLWGIGLPLTFLVSIYIAT